MEEMITSTLVDNLLLTYPEGPPADESVIQKWMQEIVENEAVAMRINYSLRNSSTDSNVTAADIYDRAISKAVEVWKLKAAAAKLSEPSNAKAQTKKKAPQSFSLFSQLDAGVWGAPRITMEDVQAATTPTERLAVFQKVAHVDDLVMDWNDILPFVQQDLSEALLLSNNVADYIMLHRTWFDQGRASSEHMPIRCDLCQNILSAIFKLVTNHWKDECILQDECFSTVHETLFSLWKLWYDMWFDLLQEPVGHEEGNGPLGTMGHQVLFLLRSLDVFNDNQSPTSTIYPAHFLALVDPTATWFGHWTVRMTPPDLMTFLNSTGILLDLLHRSANSNQTMIVTEECQSYTQLLDVSLRQHSLSMLKSILVCIRVQWFPASHIWDKDETVVRPQQPLSLAALEQEHKSISASTTLEAVSKKNETSKYNDLSTCAKISNNQLGQLFQLFFQVGILSTQVHDQAKAEPLAEVCADAIEVVTNGVHLQLNGFGSSDLGEGGEAREVLVHMLTQCQKRASQEDKRCFDNLLFDVINHSEYSFPS